MPGNDQTLRRPPMVDVAATILACVERSGRLWWTEWGGLQWSPINVTDGKPYHGADRLVLATYALASGHSERRWGTIAQLDRLNYRIRRIDRTQGITIGDECLYNAALGRRKRGTGARHDSPIPSEGHVRDSKAREILEAASTIVPPALARQGITGLAQFLRAMALACMPKDITCANYSEDTALRPLVADMACAMALSDLSVAASSAQTWDQIPCDSPAVPWTGIIRKSPDVLASCAILAETTVSITFSTMLIEARRRRRGRTASDSRASQTVDAAKRATISQNIVRQAVPATATESRLIDELHAATILTQPAQTHADDAQGQGFASPEYTLHDEAEASRLASKALSSMHPRMQTVN